MAYVDGFVMVVPKDRIDYYEKVAQEAGAVWKEHGAQSVMECIADDVPYGELTSFPRAVQAGEDEVVFFSWIVYESRMGAFDADPEIRPSARFFVASAAAWESIPDDGLPRFAAKRRDPR